MSSMLTPALQDYLKAVLYLSEQEENVRITDIAQKLKIAKASATQAIAILKDLNLVVQDRYGPVVLTEQGRKEAENISDKYRVLYNFLADILKVEPAVAEKDACLMEHAISQQTMERLAGFLNSNGTETIHNLAEDEQCEQIERLKTLDELLLGARGKVVSVTGSGAIRRRILDMGLIPGCEIRIEGFAPMGDPIKILIKGYHLSLRKEEAALIFVEAIF